MRAPTAQPTHWQDVLLPGLLVAGLYVVGFHDSLWRMVRIWLRSDTYSHGLLIPVIVVWLVLERRGELRRLAPQPCWAGVFLVMGLILAWWLARVVRVQSAEHLLLVLLVPASVLALVGPVPTRRLAFPLAFLLFAVPIGDFLVPPLMDYTARFAVWALGLSGVPVYKEGPLISVPNGQFLVEQACSGIRYLIASIAVGTLFGYLVLHRWRTRLLFMALAALLPILANGVRAYGIILLAYLSDMRLAVGVDHILYGWLFFGLVVLLLFALGFQLRRLEQGGRTPARGAPVTTGSPTGAAGNRHPLTVAAVLGMGYLAAGMVPGVLAGGTMHCPVRGLQVRLVPPLSPVAEAGDHWRPRFPDADRRRLDHYRLGGRPVDLFVAFFRFSGRGDLLSSMNRLAHRPWALVASRSRSLPVASGLPGRVRELDLADPDGHRRLVWTWHLVGNHTTIGWWQTAVAEVLARLRGRDCGAATLALSTPYALDPDRARRRLGQLLSRLRVRLARAGGAAS